MPSLADKSSTSENAFSESQKDIFLFDCEHLLQFCHKIKNGAIEEPNESILEVKLKELDSRWARLDTTYQKVMLSQDGSVEAEFKNQARGEFDTCSDAYLQCTSQIVELLKVSRLESSQLPNLQSTSRYSVPFQNYMPDNSSNCIKLPPCDTEVFKGSYEQWPSFRDMFTAVYINHTKLTPVTKLYHLRNKTKGEAGAIVKRYALSHENFDLAWKALKTRYENKACLLITKLRFYLIFRQLTAKIANP